MRQFSAILMKSSSGDRYRLFLGDLLTEVACGFAANAKVDLAMLYVGPFWDYDSKVAPNI